jgi:hypothetical protein
MIRKQKWSGAAPKLKSSSYRSYRATEKSVWFSCIFFLKPGAPNKDTRERQEQSIDCSMQGSGDAYSPPGKLHPSHI